MGVLFNGIVHVSGEPDTGKSNFAFSCGAQPEDIAFVDDDLKGVFTVNQILEQGRSFGYYINLYEKGKELTELKFHDACMKIISEIEDAVLERGKPFDALIWDTWARFENTFHPMIVTYPNKYRQFWSPNGMIKGAEQWKESFRLEAEILNRLQKSSKLVILCSHVKPHTLPGGKKSGKNVPDCKKAVVEKALLRVYLRHNDSGTEPVGLILKRISRQLVTDNGIQITSILPRKMKPFTWERIRWYWENPIGNRTPDENERPTEFELSILDDTLTEDQKEIMRMQPDAVIEEDEPLVVAVSDELAAKVMELKEAGKPVPVIARTLELSIREVNSVLQG